MRNVAATIDALQRKANDAAVTVAERDALLAKAAELRERHEPELQAAAPPAPPRSPRPPAPAGFEQPHGRPWVFTTSTTGTSATTGAVFTRMTVT